MTHDKAVVESWIALTDGPEWSSLITRAATIDAGDVAAIARLRQEAPAEIVHVALELALARRKARAKFPAQIADQLVADVAGIEMASSWNAARYKANRISGVVKHDSSLRMHDLCCGIGGDAMALAGVGLDVCAIDADPVRAWMTARNARCESHCADVTSIDLDEVNLFHLDPARRTHASGSTRRAWRFADYIPGPDWIYQLLARVPDGVMKLGPGVSIDDLPREGEIEFISESGRLTQAVLWSGRFSEENIARRATLLPDSISIHARERDVIAPIPLAEDAMRFIYTVDAGIERAQLIGELCEAVQLQALHPRVGVLTGADEGFESHWLTRFVFLERMRWNEKRVKQWLSAHHAGIVEVKTRGRVINPDVLQKRLRGKGDEPFVVFVLRFDNVIDAVIAQRG